MIWPPYKSYFVRYAGSIPASASLSSEHTSLLAYVPPGAGGWALVQVTVDGLSSATSPNLVSPYARPHVLACTKSGVSGGHFVVSGRYFETGVNANIAVKIGGKPCTGVSLLSPHSKIEATVLLGSGSNLPISVKIVGVEASLDSGCTFFYQGKPSAANGMFITFLCWVYVHFGFPLSLEVLHRWCPRSRNLICCLTETKGLVTI
jgi:hypothetical protein